MLNLSTLYLSIISHYQRTSRFENASCIFTLEQHDKGCFQLNVRCFLVVYIAPLKAIVGERMNDWRKHLVAQLGKKMVEMTGDYTLDLMDLLSDDIIISTPKKWDGITRNWHSRSYVTKAGLVILDEIHLLGADRGPILELLKWFQSEDFVPKYVNLFSLSTALANASSSFTSQVINSPKEVNRLQGYSQLMAIVPLKQKMVNPAYYRLENAEVEMLNSYLSRLVQTTFEDVEDSGCIKIDGENVEPLVLGPDTSLEMFLHILSGASEDDELPVRHNEENYNEALSGRVRYIVDKNALDDPHVKANLLFHTHFSQLESPISDYPQLLACIFCKWSCRAYGSKRILRCKYFIHALSLQIKRVLREDHETYADLHHSTLIGQDRFQGMKLMLVSDCYVGFEKKHSVEELVESQQTEAGN
ncbi:hypothetical protein OIU85_004575 [Salix viminalis]|uniref:Helicase ATP-binding domain-containing protein n=1 Tax=Salix viminalis TaxID=40686 RepID=A0A9Q0PST7_SALVM|nr:hypothetical protein OIU85_004575 [Salix viminalis]